MLLVYSSGNSTLILTPLSSTPSPIGSPSVSPSNNANEAFEFPTFQVGDVYITREDGEEEEELLLVAISRALKSEVGVTIKRLVKPLKIRHGFRKLEEMTDPLGLGFWQWKSETRRSVELGWVVECDEKIDVKSGLGAKRIWVNSSVFKDRRETAGVRLGEGVEEVLSEVLGVNVEDKN